MRNKVHAAMTPDKIIVSLDRLLLIEPDYVITNELWLAQTDQKQ